MKRAIFVKCADFDSVMNFSNKELDSSINQLFWSPDWEDDAPKEKTNIGCIILKGASKADYFRAFSKIAKYDSLEDIYGWIDNGNLLNSYGKKQQLMVVRNTNDQSCNVDIVTPDNKCYAVDCRDGNEVSLRERLEGVSVLYRDSEQDIMLPNEIEFNMTYFQSNPFYALVQYFYQRFLSQIIPENASVLCLVFLMLVVALVVSMGVHPFICMIGADQHPFGWVVLIFPPLLISLYLAFSSLKEQYADNSVVLKDKIASFMTMVGSWFFVILFIYGIVGLLYLLF